VIGVESDPGLHSAFTIAPILYGLGLIAAEPILVGRGLEGAVDRVFVRQPEPT
jgi:hypothetical protein